MEKMTYQEASKSWATGVISEKLEDTFGPNPCTSLKLLNDVTGDLLELPCDRKHCQDCGPRKSLKMQIQLTETFGEYTYILRVDDPGPIIQRMKKQNDRLDLGWVYQSAGDPQRGYILISNLPIYENQNRTSLKDWLKRVINKWMYSDGRLRRTRSIGRMSLVPVRVRTQQGTSVWKRLAGRLMSLRDIQQQRLIDDRDAALRESGLDDWQVWEDPDTKRLETSISMWNVPT